MRSHDLSYLRNDIQYRVKRYSWQNLLHLRCILVSEVVVIKDPPGDISVSTWQAMSLVRALVTQNKRLSVRLSCMIITQLKLPICFNKLFCRGNFREMYMLPLTPGRLGCQCSISLWLHCTAVEKSVLLRFEWSDPLSFENNKKKPQVEQRIAFFGT